MCDWKKQDPHCHVDPDTRLGVQASKCMSSKGFGQMRHKNKRGFQVPNTSIQMFMQPLMSSYTSYAGASFSS